MSAIRRIIPLLDRVLIEKAVVEKASKGGVLLPESALKSVNEGTVIAVGPGRKAKDGAVVPVDLKEGDRVLLPDYGGTKVTIDQKEAFLYDAGDILAKLE